jgi:hypothetical protein
MNLWWLITSSGQCRYSEIKQRGCIPLGWKELGSVDKYVKDKPGWERQFKTFIQLRGNIAYQRDKTWTAEAQNMSTGVPNIFWQWLHIKQGDYVAVMETGSQLTLGNIEVMGVAEVTQDALTSYQFNEQFHHAHQVCSGLEWLDWNRAKLGELQKPKKSFKALGVDNEQLDVVIEAVEQMALHETS